jgi:poly(beta-D-mannuronate) lyase
MPIVPWKRYSAKVFGNVSFLCMAVIGPAVFGPRCVARAGSPVVVDSLDGLREAIRTAAPGLIIEVADGTYELKRDLELKHLKGKPGKPITIRAQHLLQAEFIGDHVVKIRDAEYLVLEGFLFRLKADVNGKNGALSMRGSHHCRIMRNDFKLDEQDTGEANQTWLTVDGHSSGFNRIDHNRFSDKTKKGHYIFITGEDEYVSQHDRIECNYFVDRAYGNDANEYETIRVGESPIGNKGGMSFTVLDGNLFERCQGEDEMVSFKVGGCSFLNNTVINCHGSVVFRNGNDGVFAGNIVCNTFASRPFDDYRSGGVRFYGSGHRVFNNYFEGLNGTSMKAPLALMHGAPAGSGSLGVSDGLPATDCEIVHNTWVGCEQLCLGYESEKRLLKPDRCIFSCNIVCETSDKQLLQLFEAEGVECRGNILHSTGGKESGIEGMNYSEDAFRIVDPQLVERGDVFRLTPDSPAIDAAPNAFDYVKVDLDGVPRDSKLDVGADEYVAEPAVERRLLRPEEVGPLAIE